MGKVDTAKLLAGRAIVDEEGRPHPDFIRTMNDNIAKLAAANNQTAELVAQIALALEQAGIAIETAEATAARVSIANSYTSPGAILSAAAVDGTDCTITIADHTRKYGDGTSVEVTGSTITGLAGETTYYLYYDDPEFAGGAVTYLYSTNYLDAAQENGRHSCGDITTPALTATEPSYGGGPRPAGTGGYKTNEYVSEL